MPDMLSPDDIRLQRLQALRQIGMPNAAPYQAPPIAPDAFGQQMDDTSHLQPVSTPQLQKITGDDSVVKPLNFHQREALPITTPDAPAGSISANQSRLSKLEDERQNPWGTPENHPGTLGKVGHILSTVGQIAGTALAPGVVASIPGTALNRQAQESELRPEIAGQKKEAAAEDVAQQNAQSQGELRGAQAEALEPTDYQLPDGNTISISRKDIPNLEKAIQGNKTKENVADTTTQSKENIASQTNQTKQNIAGQTNDTKLDIAGQNNQTKTNVATGQNASRERVAQLHTEASKLIASEKQANADDPNKLTNAMKTMKQTAQATLPELDRALEETDRVAGQLGPVAGRWNDFWQGKVGANDPTFAHYKDEISFISTAVTLAHARGRMSNELFEHFQQMFDAGKQDAQNMKTALTVAKEWLSDYAKMGDKEAAPTQGGAKKPAPF